MAYKFDEVTCIIISDIRFTLISLNFLFINEFDASGDFNEIFYCIADVRTNLMPELATLPPVVAAQFRRDMWVLDD